MNEIKKYISDCLDKKLDPVLSEIKKIRNEDFPRMNQKLDNIERKTFYL